MISFNEMALQKVKAFIEAYQNGSFELVDEAEMDIMKHKYSVKYIFDQMSATIRYFDLLNEMSK